MSGHHDDGHTVAGWAGFAVATTGAAVTGLGICGWHPGIWVGLALMAAALLVTWVLHLVGWGKPPGPRPVDQRSMGVRDLSARHGHAGCLGCRLAGRRGVQVRAGAAAVPAPEAAGADVSS
ncbi:HGxxPAAW family protein [Streptomyces sp. NPDC001848]|uniref:HGxxPAAW family protein n=1 Tax=Streptomyces sp. NPDC001848 TaxID=3364618 RepID=UPI00368816D2